VAILTNTQILELLDGVLAQRADADLVEEYTEAQVNRFRGMSIAQLLKAREYYATKVAAETGAIGAPQFTLAEPFDV
jgi:hypothetical protein